MHAPTLVFYDGLCGLCDRLVRFLLPRDRHGVLKFAPLQSERATRELTPRGYDPRDLDTVFVIARWGTPDQRVLTKSRAVLHAAAALGGIWTPLTRLGSMCPSRLADRVYDLVARRRYRIFGRYEACPLPRPEWKDRFIE